MIPVVANPVARIVNYLTCSTPAMQQRFHATWTKYKHIPGWSQVIHYATFEAVASVLPEGAEVLICGCYQGLDCALFSEAMRLAGKEFCITGVDLFTDQPCADWTAEQKAKGTWEANGFIVPTMEAVKRNAPNVNVVQSDSVEFMRTTPLRFD